MEGKDFRDKFSDLRFNNNYHQYWLKGKQLTSVTKKINQFKSKFDAKKISKKVSEKEGLSQKFVLDTWDCLREVSTSTGTAFHLYVELYLKHNYIWLKAPMQIHDQIKEFNKFWDKNKNKFTVIDCELMVYDEKHKIAGTIDCLVRNNKTGIYSIWDWKTNKEIKEFNDFSKLQGKLNYLDDSEFNIYSLQICIYTYLLQKAFPDLKFKKGSLIHFPYGKEYKIYPIKDLSNEAITILNA